MTPLDTTNTPVTEEQLQLLRLQSSALDAAASAFVVARRDGTINWVNGAFTTLTGFSSTEAAGKDFLQLVDSGRQGAAFFEAMWKTVLGGETWRGEIISRRKDGSLYDEVMTITPLRDEHGAITHFVAIKEDITARKKFEVQLLRTQRLESVGRLAGGIAHDLNNILVPMLMSPPLLREAITDPSVRELVDTIEAGARRGAEIIRQLLTFSRGADGQRIPVLLSTVTSDMAKIVRETFPKNIKVIVNNTSGLWLVNGDPTQLHQILMNLCVNAADAMPEGGVLSLRCENVELDGTTAAHHSGAQAGRYVLLTVSDTGKGISPEDIGQIFDPFFTTKAVGHGTGLGLSTVMGIVTAHKGFIQVDSSRDEGTQFKIFLPSCDAPADSREGDLSQPTPTGKGEFILVVDDEDSIRSVARRLLERNGYHILEASDGESGLAMFTKHQRDIAVVLLDYLMPGMGGQKLLQLLRNADSQTRIIVISGHLAESGLPEEPSMRAHAFLPKPFTSATLLQVIHRVLSTPASLP